MPRTSTAATKAATPSKGKAIESKALKAESKSEGMRMLFEAGYTVAEVRVIFDAPYGFVYGVAKRAGAHLTAAARRAPRNETKAPAKARKAAAAPKATRSAKAPARKATATRSTRSAKTTATATAPKRASATKPSAASRVAAKIAARSSK